MGQIIVYFCEDVIIGVDALAVDRIGLHIFEIYDNYLDACMTTINEKIYFIIKQNLMEPASIYLIILLGGGVCIIRTEA